MLSLSRRLLMVVMCGLAVLGGLLGTEFSGVAQEEPQATVNSKKPAALAYEAKIAEWKDLLKKLADLRTQFQTAKGVEAEQIRKKWALTVKDGEQLLDSLRDAALAAFVESPNQDRQLTRFLVRMLKDALDQDRYEIVREAAVALIEHKCDDRSIYDIAGHASFALNDFKSAADYLRQAELKNAISPIGSNFQRDAMSYIKFWEVEQEIRKREAAQDDLPRVKMTTSKGEVVIELFENEAPDTVGNFV
ncbi:MAG: hypothetical protein GY917_20655, partial [Planctomycetaceae bacterium]|nr:hypothetical protein [Planctomycetaceae bacterium]